MSVRRTLICHSILVGILLGITGCREADRGWQPPSVPPSTQYLQEEVDQAFALVNTARDGFASDPTAAERRLVEAENTLARLSRYYLPLLEARERAYDAHRLLYEGQKRKVETELDEIEKIIDSIARAGGHHLMPELREPLDLIGETRAAIEPAPTDALGHLAALTYRLNEMGVKGRLLLPADWPEDQTNSAGPGGD